MSDSGVSLSPATLRQRLTAAAINLTIVVLLAAIAERIAANPGAPSQTVRMLVAAKTAFGLTFLFWLGCAQMRSSPGMALLKLRLVRLDAPDQRVPLPKSLLRPLPFFVFGVFAVFPVQLLTVKLAPVQFFGVLLSALFLAANAAPLWSTAERRSLMDKWLGVRVIPR